MWGKFEFLKYKGAGYFEAVYESYDREIDGGESSDST